MASELLKPRDTRLMRCYPVSRRTNYVANDNEKCLRPVELAQIQNRLFSQCSCQAAINLQQIGVCKENLLALA